MPETEESLQDTEKNVSGINISPTTNIMSDKHFVQEKNYNVSQDYRASVLPNVIKNWDAINEDIQSNFIKVNSIFLAFISSWSG